MKQRKSIPVRRKPGRPATGHDPMLNFRSPTELTARIESWAAGQEPPLTRSQAVRHLIEIGLTHKPPRKDRPL